MEILSHPLAYRVIAAATAVLLGIGLIGAATVDSDDADTLDATADTTSTLPGGAPLVPVPAPGEPGGPPATEPGTLPAPGQPAPGAPAPTAAPAPAEPPGPATPTRPGLYRYKVTTDGEEGKADVRVTEEGGAPAGERRLLHRRTADGSTTESSIAWRSNGIFERSRTFPGSGGGSGSPCDWEPDVLLAPRPLRADSAWSWDSRCTSQVEGQQADFHFTGQARVTGAERATVEGRQVAVWRIQGTGKINIVGTYQGQPFTVVVDITSNDLFAPEHGLVVRGDSTNKVTPPGGQPPQETRVIEELQNLDPA